jgi:hypothetical protein
MNRKTVVDFCRRSPLAATGVALATAIASPLLAQSGSVTGTVERIKVHSPAIAGNLQGNTRAARQPRAFRPFAGRLRHVAHRHEIPRGLLELLRDELLLLEPLQRRRRRHGRGGQDRHARGCSESAIENGETRVLPFFLRELTFE